MIGPIFHRELATLPRRGKHYINRVVFALMIFGIICTTWLLLAGIQPVQSAGDLARFGVLIFQLIAPFQLVVLMFTAVLAGTTAVSHEKDRQTIILLLMTSLKNSEVVLGKVGAGLLASFNAFLASLPATFMVLLLGGVSLDQVIACTGITAATIFTCAALGATIAFWREKTFQSLAITILLVAFWLGLGEVAAAGWLPGVPAEYAILLSPLRAIIDVSQPIPSVALFGGSGSAASNWTTNAWYSGAVILAIGLLALTISIVMLRVWNPSREKRRSNLTTEGAEHEEGAIVSEDGRKLVKAWKSRPPKTVWDNPVLWREMRTLAYGRKIVFVRLAYLLSRGW